MKIARVRIENFKRFAPPGVEIDFRNKVLGSVADRFLLLGDNGSGKTTIFQAIALTLSLAQSRTPTVDQFRWTGWVPERFGKHGDPIVELEIHFEDDEIAAVREAAQRWRDWKDPRGADRFVEPGDSRVVTLRLEGSRVRAGTEAEFRQFQGRFYAAAIARTDPPARALFSRLPGVFWYDQYRNVALPGERENPEETSPTFSMGVHKLDDILRSWTSQRGKGSRSGRDYYGELEKLYQWAFPGRSFAGVEGVYDAGPTPVGDMFVLSDGRRTYALAEMSAGEQAIFPILFAFVQQQIHRSIVLIDEIDLNLHPPLAQTFLGLLPRLGEGNQFLFTTHSEVVSSLISPHTIHRLPEGRLCL